MFGVIVLKSIVFPLLAYSADRITLHPLDNILSHKQKYGDNAFQIAKNLYKQRSLYSGFTKPFITFGPARVIMLGSFYLSLDLLLKFGFSFTLSALLAGIGSSVIDATLTCPGEVYRTCATFNLAEPIKLKQYFKGYLALLGRSLIGATTILAGTAILVHYEYLPPPICNSYCAGFITGLLSQFATSPFDLIKTEFISTSEPSYPKIIAKLVKHNSLYQGLFTKIIRMSLGSALVMGLIETFGSLLKSLQV